MKKLHTSGYLAFCFCLILGSCIDQHQETQESIYKNSILGFIASEKLNSNEENNSKIDALEASLNFYKIDYSKLTSGKELYVVDIKETVESAGENKKVIFILQGNELLAIRIIVFHNTINNNYLNLIKDLIANKPHSYTGKVSFLTIYSELMFYNVFNNGVLTVNGATLPLVETNDNSKINGCTAWYLIVTYFYANGTTSQTSEYIGTTCDCFENTTRSGARVACGGGGGGGSEGGSGLPSQPQQGDTHYIALNNGVTRILEYRCSDYGCNWQVVGTTLPVAVVIGHRDEYHFLPINPYPNQLVIDPSNMKYTYNANLMQWEGTAGASETESTIVNNVTHPCIYQQVQHALAENVTNQISNLIQTTFNINDVINLEINQADYLASNESGITSATRSGEYLNVEITLNENTLPLTSQEYIMSTVYHELLHAVMYANNITLNTQHSQMVNQYLNILSTALREHFPTLSNQDAIDLAWGGLQETPQWNDLTTSQRNRIIATNDSHRTATGQAGHPCN